MSKKKSIPKWIFSFLWVLLIFFTAFFSGKFLALFLETRLNIPQTITLAKEKKPEKTKIKSFSVVEDEILPLFNISEESMGGSSPSGGNPSTELDEPPSEEEEEEPAKTIDWDKTINDPSGRINLSGTVIGPDMAIAFVTVDGMDISLSLGQQVGSYRVESIMKNMVTLRKDDSDDEKIIAMNMGEPVVDDNVRRRPRPGRPREDGETVIQEKENINLDEVISFGSDGKAIVDRRKFNALLKPPSRFASEIKFVPNDKGGNPYGIKISYLEPGSFFERLGMKNGDVLVKTNDKELKSVEDSFTAYQMFRNEENLVLQVDRGGQIIQIPIDFR